MPDIIVSSERGNVNLAANSTLTVTRLGIVVRDQVGSTAAVTAAGNNDVFLDGSVSGRGPSIYGFQFNANSNEITIGKTGYAFGEAGAFLFNGGLNVFKSSGLIGSSAGTAIDITGGQNAMSLFASSAILGQLHGMAISGGANSVANLGSIYGASGDGLHFGTGAETIYNAGTIFGGDHAISIGSNGPSKIVNDGTLRAGGVGDPASASVVFSQSAINLTNKGWIEGYFVAVRLDGSDGSTIVNNGHITGSLWTGTGNDMVVNNGVFTRQALLNDGNDIFDGRNSLSAVEAWGEGGNDTLHGGAFNDRLYGGDGNDVFFGGKGGDQIDGGAGTDIVDFEFANASVGVIAFVDYTRLGKFVSYTANFGEARGDDYHGIEGFIGSAFNDKFIVDDQPNIVRAMAGNDAIDGGIGNDRLFGGSGDDLILGSVGDDYLEGNPGNDRLNGGIGSDTLIGGLGNDTFTFSAALNASNLDHVFDFSNVAGNNDNIHLDHRFFGGVTNANLASTVFFGAAAHDASDRIIYDHTTGLLSYDADGNGSQAAVAFAQLENKAVLTLADFVVI